MKSVVLVVLVLLFSPLVYAQTAQPTRPPIDSGTGRTPSTAKLDSTGIIGDFEITVTGQEQDEQSRSGGIDTTIHFSITYIGTTYGNPQSKLAFSGYGTTELLYTSDIFGCDESPLDIDQRLFTGGSLDTSICFTVHPDDADVLSLGVSTTEGDSETLWLATTKKSEAGPTSVPTVTSVEVEMTDNAFSANEFKISANTDVEFTIVNSGFVQHDFVILDTEFGTELLSNGESEVLIVNLPPGEYQVECTAPGHAQFGMTATIIVEGPATTGGDDAEPEVELEVEVELIDTLKFSPDKFTIPADTDVAFTITNSGYMQHDFVILDTEFGTELLNNGESEELIVNLPPGEYQVECTLPGHAQAGMVATIIVEEPATTGADDAEPEVELEVEVGMSDDFSFSQDQITIPANTNVALIVTNDGFLMHDFVIRDTEYATDVLNGGDSEVLIVNLPPGEYKFFCSVPGHAPSGMNGTLIVE